MLRYKSHAKAHALRRQVSLFYVQKTQGTVHMLHQFNKSILLCM